MAFQIDNVLTAMNGSDFARNNLFEVSIPFINSGIEFKAKAASEPPAEVGIIQVGYLNRKYKIMGDRTYGEWTITVYADEPQETRQQFIDLQALGQSMGRTSGGGTPDTYIQTGYVRRLNRDGEIVKEYEIQDFLVQTVGEVSLDWDSNDQVETFDVTMAINSWE